MAHYLLKGVQCLKLMQCAWLHCYNCPVSITDRCDRAAAVHRFTCADAYCLQLSIVLPHASTLQAFNTEYTLRDIDINRLRCSVAFEEDLRSEAQCMFIHYPGIGYKHHLLNWRCPCNGNRRVSDIKPYYDTASCSSGMSSGHSSSEDSSSD